MPYDIVGLTENLEVTILMAKFKMIYCEVLSLSEIISQVAAQVAETTHCPDFG